LEQDKIESILESLLFVAGEPLPLKRLAELVGGKRKEVQAALAGLVERWSAPERGLRVVEIAGGWQIQTAEDNAAWVGKLISSRPVRLSRASLECLAIVAYKQPVTRIEIDEIRGVDSGGVLKTLLEHGLIKISGRKDVAGKPLIYSTDKRFLEFFRLKSLSELPTLRELAEVQEERLAEARQEEQAEASFEGSGEGQGPEPSGPAGVTEEPGDDMAEPETEAPAEDDAEDRIQAEADEEDPASDPEMDGESSSDPNDEEGSEAE
jgi:segregation and condensation protein B